jgi:hypothetical protein
MMVRLMFKECIFVWLAIFTFVWVEEAHAYLDPGMGSMLFQSLVAFAVGGFYLIKMYWKKITGFLFQKKNMPSGEEK